MAQTAPIFKQGQLVKLKDKGMTKTWTKQYFTLKYPFLLSSSPPRLLSSSLPKLFSSSFPSLTSSRSSHFTPRHEVAKCVCHCRKDALYYSKAKDYSFDYKKISLMHSTIGTAEEVSSSHYILRFTV